jgi:DNA-binding transcriptional regulator YdaS (Cro superfamily)
MHGELSETMRKVKIFLLQERTDVKKLALKLGISPNHLYLIFAGRKRASIELAKMIEELTQGTIKTTDLKIGAHQSRYAPKCPTCGARLSNNPQ